MVYVLSLRPISISGIAFDAAVAAGAIRLAIICDDLLVRSVYNLPADKVQNEDLAYRGEHRTTLAEMG